MKPGLIINEEPMDEIHDFLNYSLSDACFSIGKRVIPHVNSENSFSQESPSNIISPKQQTSIQKSQRFLIDQNQVTEQSDGRNNSIIQSFMLKKFIQKLSWKKKLNSNFNKYHYDVINDKGSNFNLRIFKQNTMNLKPLQQKRTEKVQDHEIYKTIIQIAQITIIKIQAIIDKIPIIYPEYKLKIIWDLLALVARLYFMFGIPLDLAWTTHQYLTGRVLDTTIFFMLVLICDILVSFNTAIYEYGQVVTQRSKIVSNVITKSYGLEFCSVFVLLFYLLYILAKKDEFNVNQNWYYIFLVTFLIQYRNITKYTEQIEEVLNLSKPVSCLLELLKLMLLLFFGLHLFACLWFWIGDYSVESGKSWLIAKSLENEEWQVQYLYSIYFSAVTMFTVGYGDVTPQNQIETIVCILFMVVCSIQLSYSVNTVGAMIDKISYYNKEKMKKVQTINTYMQNKKITSSNQEETQEEKELINQLSENLREKLIFEANSQILLNCPLFKYHFSDQLKKKLVKKIKQVYVQPENIIDFDKEKKRDIFIMFIEEGSIQIFIENELQKGNLNQVDVSVVSTINQGASLGVLSFLTGVPASERFRSVGFTKLLILSREDFLNIIPEFPEDYEVFREMHDDLIYNSDSKFLKLSCFSCKSQSHRAIECPMLHFIPDREFIIKKHQYNRDQSRNEHTKGQSYLRNPFRQRSAISALNDMEMIQEAAEYITVENQKFFSLYEDDVNCEQVVEPEQEIKISVNNLELVNPMGKKTSQVRHSMKMSQSHSKLSNRQSGYLEVIKEEDEVQNPPKSDDESQSPFRISNLPRKSDFKLKLFSKRSQSINVDDQITRKLKPIQRFKRAVMLIRNLYQISKKKSQLKAQTKSIVNSIVIKNPIESYKSLQISLDKKIEKFKHLHEELKDTDIKQAGFLKIKFRMLTNENYRENMDTIKEFKNYFSQNNFKAIMQKYIQIYTPVLREQNIQNIFTRLVKYTLFPYIYIDKYKYKIDPRRQQISIDEQIVEKNERVKSVSRRTSKKSKKNAVKPIFV